MIYIHARDCTADRGSYVTPATTAKLEDIVLNNLVIAIQEHALEGFFERLQGEVPDMDFSNFQDLNHALGTATWEEYRAKLFGFVNRTVDRFSVMGDDNFIASFAHTEGGALEEYTVFIESLSDVDERTIDDDDEEWDVLF